MTPITRNAIDDRARLVPAKLSNIPARFGLCLLLASLIVFQEGARAQEALSKASASSSLHKVQVRNRDLGDRLTQAGARLIADYGSYQLFETSAVSEELMGNPQVALLDEENLILLHAGALDTRQPAVKALAKKAVVATGKRLHLIQFAGPVRPEWHQELEKTGARIVAYIPHNAYLVYGDAATLGQVQSFAGTAPHVQWEGSYLDDYKVHPDAKLMDAQGNAQQVDTDEFAIQLVADGQSNPKTLQLLDQLKLAPFQRQDRVLEYLNVIVRLAPETLNQVSAQPDVVSIQPHYSRKKSSERQDQIAAGNVSQSTLGGPGYLAWLEGKGFTLAQFKASGFVVDVSDSGIDDGSTTPNHFALYDDGDLGSASRVAYSRLMGNPNHNSTLKGCDGHGTLNAHIVAGYDDQTGFPHTDSSGYHYGLGVCPFVRVGASVIFDPDNFTSPDYTTLLSAAYQNGARISNNSWGGRAPGGRTGGAGYDIDAQTYDALVRDSQPAGSSFAADGNQEMVIVFAAGNDGPAARTMESPGTGKNVITVGAAENVQPIGGTDSSGVPDSQANNINDIIGFSGRGPCADGRHKPDLVAPATHVTGGVIQAPNPGTNGTADSCFTGNGISGGVQSNFFPANQEFFSASSGTSHATPCITGSCALLRQYFINQGRNAPSPAMTKAYLLNSARYLSGANAGDNLWSDTQGMGEVNLGLAFDGRPRLLRDQVGEDLFTASGQSRTFTGTIVDSKAPFRVTLAWTDAPGNTTGNAFNNDLDLTVTVGDVTYKGNVFNGAVSVAGGTADNKNNVESVLLPAGVSGEFVINVMAVNINSDGVPNNAEPLDQDFALVAYNAIGASIPIVAASSSTLLSESCTPTNGVIDAGETVSVLLALSNVGVAKTTNLVATLQTSGGVTSPSAAQNYGALAPGDAAVSREFTFTASASCGETLTATLDLRDGTNEVGTVSFNWQLGQFVKKPTFTESFDEGIPPALPPGWTTSASGSDSPWTINTASSDSAPNAAFVSDPVGVGLSELISPRIPILSASAHLTFQNNFNLDADRRRTTVGYDGGVLEIQIDDGPFTDIVSAGGSFVSGGYTRTISSTFNNPLAGRDAWSGRSSGFITTDVALPDSVAGHDIVLKWRCATDSTTSGTGWFIDSIEIVDGGYVCCGSPVSTNAPAITKVASSEEGVAISIVSVAGHTYTLEFKNALTDPAWQAVLPSVEGTGSVIVLHDSNVAAANRFYRIRSD